MEAAEVANHAEPDSWDPESSIPQPLPIVNPKQWRVVDITEPPCYCCSTLSPSSPHYTLRSGALKQGRLHLIGGGGFFLALQVW